ncbi:hypothetical protein M8J76_013854 [Diaphorina citri]|nr:hypothetical protein M8J76_013854 [Diaphorina citri]
MLTMSTLMMPAPTITTMTNPGPIPIAQHTKLEPKFVFTTNHNMTMIQQKPEPVPPSVPLPHYVATPGLEISPLSEFNGQTPSPLCHVSKKINDTNAQILVKVT